MHLFHSTSAAATRSRYVAAMARSTRATLGPLSADAAAAIILRCTIIILSVFSVAATSGNNGKCCAQQQPPISDCSFSYYDEDIRNVSCEVKNGRRRGYVHGSCPDYGYTSKDHIPGPVKKLRVEPFVTSCRHTMSNATPLMASSCNTTCRDYSGKFFSGINITFKADEISAEDLEGIEISLRKMSGEGGVTVWCARMHIGENGLRWAAASQHTFHYDGFIGLEPTAVYEVSVKTLPTSVYSDNAVSTRVTIPEETCWSPDIEDHEMPFMLNFTLYNGAQSSLTEFQTLVEHRTGDLRRREYLQRQVNFSTTGLEYFTHNGKLATTLVFDCLLPDTDVRLLIRAPQCPYCQWYDRTITIQGQPPEMRNCPSDIIVEVELGNTTVVGPLNWEEPEFINPCNFSMSVTRSHDPQTSTFHVGGITRVSYSATLHGYHSECSFTVQAKAVDTTPPEFISCPDDLSYIAEAGQDGLKITWVEPVVWDTSPTLVESTFPSGSWFPAGENTTVTYRAKDEAGNGPVECEFHVYVAETPTASLTVIIIACIFGSSLAGCVVAIGICQGRRKYRSSESSEELQKKKGNNHPDKNSEPGLEFDCDWYDTRTVISPSLPGALSLQTVNLNTGIGLEYLRDHVAEPSPGQGTMHTPSNFEEGRRPFHSNLAGPPYAVSTPNIVLSSSMEQSHSDNNYWDRCHDPMSGFPLLGGGGREGQGEIEPHFVHRDPLEVIAASGSTINVPVMQT